METMTMKKYITQQLGEISKNVLEGTIDQVCINLQEIKGRHLAEGYIDISIEVDSGWDYTDYILHGKRIETDKEYDARLVRERRARERAFKAKETAARAKEKQRQEQEARDRAEYLRLKKKFGD